MKAPQIVFIVLTSMVLGIELAKDGQPRGGNYSFTFALVDALITIALLWWGGFFSQP